MKKILFITNVPAPYTVKFFEFLRLFMRGGRHRIGKRNGLINIVQIIKRFFYMEYRMERKHLLALEY